MRNLSAINENEDIVNKKYIDEVGATILEKTDLIISRWDSTENYVKDDCVLYNSKPYYCVVEEATIGTFDTNEWEEFSEISGSNKLYDSLLGLGEGLISMYNDFDDLTQIVGNPGDLTTTNKSTIVGAINEVNAKGGGGGGSTDITTTINSSSTDTQVPSAKAVYSQILKYLCPEWNNQTTYTDGEIVLKDTKPYACVVATATIGSFVVEEWEDLSLQNVDVFNSLVQIQQAIETLFNRIPSMTTSVNSSSTDSQVPTAKAVYNQILKYLCSEWDETTTYNAFSFVWYEGQIYVHLNSTPAQVGVFDPQEWTEVSTLNIDILNTIVQIQRQMESLSSSKQNNLVSGTNIKTIEGQSVLGSGNLDLNIPTNTNQLTNGAGYITGINSNDVVNALGYTPYNAATNNANFATIKIVRW